MNIKSIIPQIYVNTMPHKGIKYPCSFGCDTFTKSDNSDTHNGYSYNEFLKWAENTDFLSKAADIIDFKGKILGSGFEGVIYEIPDNDKWVIKEFKRGSYINEAVNKPVIDEINDNMPDFNLGQEIAKVTLPAGKNISRIFYVLKKQKGKSYGVSYADKDIITKYNINKHIEALKTAASLPDETYSKLIRDIKAINNAGYKLDFSNPNNMLIYFDKKTINFVDVEKSNDKSTQFSDMLFSLLDANFAVNFNNSASDNENYKSSKQLSAQIYSKYQQALAKAGCKFEQNNSYDKITQYLLK